jgi:phage terminase large subunit
LHGGRSSSKSWDAAGFAVFLACNYQVRFLCTRQFQNRITESVYTLLKIQIERFGLRHQFHIADNAIRHKASGSEFMFYGLARNIDEIKSLESIDICWIEEGHNLTKAQWDILEPTLRKEGSQFWIIFNPGFITDFVYQRFVVNPPPDTIVRQINYPENPFLSSTILKVIEAAKAEDEEDYAHIYLGVPLIDDDSVIIKRSWIEAAIDAHIKLGFEATGRKIIGFDVADSGDDKCANIFVHGSVALWADEWKGGEDKLLQSCTRTYDAAVSRDAAIRYDSIGVGASAGAKIDELNTASSRRVKYSKFNAGAAVANPESFYARDRMEKIKNKDFFANLKAQTWWCVADRFRNTYDAITNGTEYPDSELISIASDMPYLEKLKSELSTPKRDFDNNGKVKVESKKDLAKRDVDSPNIADSFVMCYAPGNPAPIKIRGGALAKAIART